MANYNFAAENRRLEELAPDSGLIYSVYTVGGELLVTHKTM